MRSTLRWGILGTARINRRVIPAIRLAPRSTLVAVASRTRARAEAYATEWGVPRALDGYQALLDDPAIDAVYIPLPNSQHVPWTLAAVAAGKHVLCEKPMALPAADIDRIHAAAGTAKVVVEEGFMYRHEPLTAKVLELERGGRIETIAVAGSPELFARQIEHFENSVLDGAPSVVTLADSRYAAATLSALLDSARDTTALYPE